jgi:rhamnosyltransferase subunit B
MANIVLLTMGTGGDLHPFLQICNMLNARDHRVTLITDPKFESVAKRYSLNYVPLYTNEQAERMYMLMSRDTRPEGGLFIREQMQLQLQVCIHIHDYIKEQFDSSDTILVSHDNLNLIGQTIAETLKLPYVIVFMAPYFVMRMPLHEYTYTVSSDVINLCRKNLHLPPVYDWRTWMKMLKWKIGLWPEWFALGETNWIFNVTPVGFVWNRDFEIGDISDELKEFLSIGEPPVLITHGTSEPSKPNFFQASIEACTILERRGILVTPYEKAITGCLPSNILRYKYLPFASLLPYIGAIIHHGGIGTLNQALMAGVPQLVLASGQDRPDNGRRIQRLGIGECLPPSCWKPDLVAEALRRFITAQVQARCKDLSTRQANIIDPTITACDIIESSLRKGELQKTKTM